MNAHIKYTKKLTGRLNPPSSKNYTTRYLLVAALAEGESRIHYPAKSADSDALIRCLVALGATIDEEVDHEGGRHLRVVGFGRNPQNPGTLNAGNAGAVTRFLMGIAALLSEVRFETDFDHSLGQRPHDDLLLALEQLGVRSQSEQGKLPIVLHGGNLHGGHVQVSGSVSSQFLSALLFVAPLIPEDVEIDVINDLVSKPLVRTTIEVIQLAGIRIHASDDLMHFEIPGGQAYLPGEYSVNGDYPSAAAVLAAGALTNSEITVERLFEDRQGERAIVDVLQHFGVGVNYDGCSVSIQQHRGLRGIEFDGDTATDMVLALLPMAALAAGETRVHSIGNLRMKECDRISVPVEELQRVGVDCDEGPTEIVVRGNPKGYEGGIEVQTHDDHRVAQMLTLLGLRCRKGLIISDADTVAKSYPAFFDDLISLGARIECK